uniref:Uncharacterized protein n=1 Tax=Cyanidiaceae sp. MX-AZ01 TaxID=1503164 RepID=A0A060A8F6_9RHOD|nr:hypothetical protein [Cyanidiaceae sp. MX-AZ01]
MIHSDSIPNSVVKMVSGDDTWGDIPWESSSMPSLSFCLILYSLCRILLMLLWIHVVNNTGFNLDDIMISTISTLNLVIKLSFIAYYGFITMNYLLVVPFFLTFA